MRARKRYLVSGQLTFRHKNAASYNGAPWFAEIPRGKKWRSMSTAVWCKTKAHALAQYNRLQRGTRQIDRYGFGDRHAWRWDQ